MDGRTGADSGWVSSTLQELEHPCDPEGCLNLRSDLRWQINFKMDYARAYVVCNPDADSVGSGEVVVEPKISFEVCLTNARFEGTPIGIVEVIDGKLGNASENGAEVVLGYPV